MTVLLDTSVLLALLDADDPFHTPAVGFYEQLTGDLVTTPILVAEMDHLVAQRTGRAGSDRLWSSLESGAITVRWWATAMAETLSIVRARPKLGLADASLLALSPVAGSTSIATFDRTHFTAVRTADGLPFTLLP